MTVERKDGATPKGGDYSIGVYVQLASLTECDKAVADGLVVTEFRHDGAFVCESIIKLDRQASPPTATPETPEEHFKRLGIEMEDETGDSIVTFVGPRGAAYARKLTGR